MKYIILSALMGALGYMIHGASDAARPAYSHAASMYESIQDECADYNVMHCSKEMLVVLRAQR